MKKLIVIGILTLVSVMAFIACATPDVYKAGEEDNFRVSEQETTQAYQNTLSAARPYPLAEMTDSLERRQLIEKLRRFNDPNRLGYVTLVSDFGTVITSFTILGKPSNTNSMLTITDQVECIKVDGDDPCVVVTSPGDDGSYGENEDGTLFFDTNGGMIIWNGKYLYTDIPHTLTTEPLVTYNVTDEPSDEE